MDACSCRKGMVGAIWMVVLVALTVSPPASSVALACSGPGVPAPPGPAPGMLLVQGVQTNDAIVVCGPGIFGVTAPCPPAVVIVTVPGAYCGPVVPPGGAVTCAWTPGLLAAEVGGVGLYIALDYGPLIPDGNTVSLGIDPEGFPPVVDGPLAPFPALWTIANPGPTPARVIAYPTNPAAPHPALLAVQTYVGCE